ncbi:MAG: 4-(cytidine 5'-diphospho)-2-C-methyl-D-erythritol kinase [Chloroflexi bacterium]|nr:4-(cytidine 5'-diphospho)-2-C-methyl-D-erythritol kinase [Chloroflexota bacterium]
MRIRAYAKINLGFEVLGRRSDGLHEVATILQTIDLADSVTLSPSDRITLHCPGMEVRPDNLILQAAYLMKERAGVSEGVAIRCIKRIPVGSGLAGGSADAAAVLCGLWSYWDVRLDQATVYDVAGQLGADVPFCLAGGTALATGDGRQLELLPDAPPHWVVLVPLGSTDPEKTGHMYRHLTKADWSSGEAVHRQAQALQEGRIDYGCLRSAFAATARETWPEVNRALASLEASGALAACVSGAGPSCFGLFRTRGEAVRARNRLVAQGCPGMVHRFVTAADCRSRPAPPV